jgi:hypothetical protein
MWKPSVKIQKSLCEPYILWLITSISVKMTISLGYPLSQIHLSIILLMIYPAIWLYHHFFWLQVVNYSSYTCQFVVVKSTMFNHFQPIMVDICWYIPMNYPHISDFPSIYHSWIKTFLFPHCIWILVGQTKIQ